jgi:hypothetical protein
MSSAAGCVCSRGQQMFTTLIKLAFLEKLNREQLITMLMERLDGLSLNFTKDWLEKQSSDHLKLFLLAAKLFRVLRQKESPMPSISVVRPRHRNASE